ncbi:MAG: hypothetical protein QW561_01685 [Candidatus Aenigmatarchaeota archaeon]
MTFGELKTRIGYFVPELTATEISKHINNRYQQILSLYPWSFLKKQATLSLTANQALYSLASDVGQVLDVIVSSTKLRQLPLVTLDQIDPGRTAAAGLPTEWADRGVDASNLRQIELHPKPSSTYTSATYNYIKKVPALSADTDVVLVRDDVLQEATLIDCYRHAFSKNTNYGSLITHATLEYEKKIIDAVAEDLRRAYPEFVTQDVSKEETLGIAYWLQHWYTSLYKRV